MEVASMALIKKSNKLIQARYSLSKNEQRIILYLLQTIQRPDEEFKKYEFMFSELVSLMDINERIVFQELKSLAKGIRDKGIDLQISSPNDVAFCNWLSWFQIDNVNKKIILRFDPGLKEFLLQLKSYFTTYNIKHVSSFACKHSLRIYELSKQYQKIGKRKISIVELKYFLDIDDFYPRIIDMKKRVINPALKDINQYSDLTVSAKYIKTGRKISHIEFTISDTLKGCTSEKRKALILEEKQTEATRQAKAAKTIKANTGLKAKWNSLSDAERKKWGVGPKAFGNFMAHQGELPD
jgi:plasmid replication initiation protein